MKEYTVVPIGYVHNKHDAPAVPEEIMRGESTIELLAEYEDGLYLLEESEYIKVIFLLDRSHEYALKLQSRSGRVKGVFASRSPKRPNNIGTTTAKLLSLEGKTLRLTGLDCLNGTPVLDIKTFSPLFDAPGIDGPYLDIIHKSDRGDVEELCARVWEGWDYIPNIFDEWVEDGGFHCLRLGGKVVALGKYTRRKNGVIWLEGLRVHPDHKGKGYARIFSDRLTTFLEMRDWMALRFMTAEIGTEARHMAEKSGFRVVGKYDYLNIEREGGGREGAREDIFGSLGMENETHGTKIVGRETNTLETWAFIMSTEEHKQSGLFFRSWNAWDMDKELVDSEIGAGRCCSVRNEKGIEALAFYTHYKPYNSLSVSYISGTDEGKRLLIRRAVDIFKENGLSVVEMKSACEDTIRVAEEEGFKKGHAGTAIIYEKRRG